MQLTLADPASSPAFIELLRVLAERLDDSDLGSTGVIPWSCPVPAFGDASKARIATLGLNPSNLEFVDGSGIELDGASRRLETLRSLGLDRWSVAGVDHLKTVAKSCAGYFSRNPYHGWFRPLDQLLSDLSASYYGAWANACHLDLIPYATASKWTELSVAHRSALLTIGGSTLGQIIRDSPIQLIIVNGRGVVSNLERIAGVTLAKESMRGWTLPRRSRAGVVGVSFRGELRELCGVDLKRRVYVLGFNHNLQSSFGVTRQVKASIRRWITAAAKEVLL